MPTTLTCECGKKLRVKEEWVGRRVRCPNCQRLVKVPEAAGDPGLEPLTLAPQEPEKPAPPATTGTCPNCGQALPLGAVLCTQCGFDSRTGVVHAAATPPAAATEVEEKEAGAARASILILLAGMKRWFIVGALGLAAIAVIWYGLQRVAHPDSGPYQVTYEPVGSQLEMRIFWHNVNLPNEPTTDPEETTYVVSQWYVRLPDGTTLTPRWSKTSYKYAVNVEFVVPMSAKIVLGLGENHEAEIDTPDTSDRRKVVLKWHK